MPVNLKHSSIDLQAFYRAKECARIFGVGVSSWHRWVEQGRVKRPIRLAPRTVAWEGSYLIELRERLIAECQG